MEHLGELEEHVEALFAAHAIAAGDDDGGALEVVLGGLHMVVEHFHHESFLADVLAHLGIDDLFLASAFVDSLLHDAAAHGRHLGTVVGVDDGGHDVAAESGTDLVEQVLIGLAALLVLVGADFELRAVGGEAAGEARGDARTEVAADDRGAHQADLRLLLLEEVHHDVGVGSRGVGEELGGIEDEEFVDAVRQHLLLDFALDAGADGDGVQLHAEFIRQLAALGEKFLRDFAHFGAFNLNIYKNVVHILFLIM